MNCKNRSSEEGGFVLVLVAMVLVVLIAFVALGVDSGILYSARTSAQEAGDAGALAAAFTFVANPTDPQPATAIAYAKAVASNYTIFGNPVQPADVTVNVDTANRRVTVDVQATRTTYFAKVLGIANANIQTHSVAEAGKFAGEAPNPKPFFLPNTIFSGDEACDACMAGLAQQLIDPATGIVTSFGEDQIGKSMSIKPQKPAGSLEPSIFYLIDFNGGGGGVPEIDGWIDGTDPAPPVACGKILEVEKGNKVSIKQGVDNLLGAPPDDEYKDVGEYAINGGALSDTSKALVTVPIWDTCASGFCSGGIPTVGGHEQIAVIGFALVFLDGISVGPPPAKDEALTGHLINISGCSGTPTGSGSSVLGGFPLRLVR